MLGGDADFIYNKSPIKYLIVDSEVITLVQSHKTTLKQGNEYDRRRHIP